MVARRLPETGRLAGLMTYPELAAAGFSRPSIRGLTSRGVLIRVRRGAYARADLAAGLGDRAIAIAAAVAVAGQGAVASHEDAAFLHGLGQLDRPRPDLISVSRPGGHDRLLRGSPSVRVRATSLPRTHVTVRGAVPVTSAARTVADLARSAPFKAGVVVADSALYRGKTNARELDTVIGDCRR
ncbi:MAG TPA: type IV toxin-antitoxin system AbiEi family antitoxin domain-containing protein [Streptosporangiaceae bacterium]